MTPDTPSIPGRPTGPIVTCACGCGCELLTCNGVCSACRSGTHGSVRTVPSHPYGGAGSDSRIRGDMIAAGRGGQMR